MKKLFLFALFFAIILLNIRVSYAEEAFTILKGDADGNGVVNSEDALLVLEIIAQVKDMDNTFSIRHCDLTGDYEISARDALNILKVSAKIAEQETIENITGMNSSLEYKDGYPVGYVVDSKGTMDTPRVSYKLWSGDYYGAPNAYKFESNAAFWKLNWLIEDNIGTDNMEFVYSNYVNVLNLPVSLSDTPRFFTSVNVPPLGRKVCLMYYNGVPYIYVKHFYTNTNGEIYATYKYTGEIPYELSEEYLKKTYLEWRKEQYESESKSVEKGLNLELYISDKAFTIRNASDSANTARLVIKLKLDPLMAKVGTKDWENLKGTYRFDVLDDGVYIIDLRYDGYNISTDFNLSYSFDVLNESFTGPEVIEVKAYDLDGLEVPVSYTITHPDNK